MRKLFQFIGFAILLMLNMATMAFSPLESSQENVSTLTSVQSDRENAAEVLNIVVDDVRYKRMRSLRSDHCDQRLQLTASATIKSVVRSAANLQSGDNITINYVVTEIVCPNVAENPMPRLSRQASYPAFLICENKSCQLAAENWSFMSDDDFNLELERRETEVNWWQMGQ